MDPVLQQPPAIKGKVSLEDGLPKRDAKEVIAELRHYLYQDF